MLEKMKSPFLLLLLAIIASSKEYISSFSYLKYDFEVNSCPELEDSRYRRFGEHCLFFDQTFRTRDEASINCKSVFNNETGALFEPRTRELNTLVYEFVYELIGFQIASQRVHIGVDDKYIQGC